MRFVQTYLAAGGKQLCQLVNSYASYARYRHTYIEYISIFDLQGRTLILGDDTRFE